jgi:hypothetical protein
MRSSRAAQTARDLAVAQAITQAKLSMFDISAAAIAEAMLV